MPEMGWGVYGAGAGAGLAIAFLAGFDALALALAGVFFATGFLAATFFAARLTVFFFAMARNLHHVRVAGQRTSGSMRKTGWRGASATKAASGASGRASKYGRVMGTSAT
jgi:hypothetical protein